jgi:hypothetical protein
MAGRRELHERERVKWQDDIQLKNQPASMLPGGVTYVTGMTTGKVPFAECERDEMVAGIQLKNQPASMLPGGVTYVTGMTTGKAGFRSDANAAHRKRVEQDLNVIKQELARMRAATSVAMRPRSLSPAKRNILQVMEAMPPEELDSRQTEVLIEKVQAEIDAKYRGVGRARSTIQPMLKDFLQSRLSRRPR